jgi:CspA family cold shock protein
MSDAVKTGTVKMYKPEGGWGFIRADDGSDIFFHVTDFDQRFDEPIKGDRVSFVAGMRNGRPRAHNVTPTQPSASCARRA